MVYVSPTINNAEFIKLVGSHQLLFLDSKWRCDFLFFSVFFFFLIFVISHIYCLVNFQAHAINKGLSAFRFTYENKILTYSPFCINT